MIRLISSTLADGPHNMAADETMLIAASAGQASLRFYGWTEPTLSLGYFQPAATRLSDPRLATLPWVRRPTGGAMLVHHHELTYALAVPLGLKQAASSQAWMPRMHAIVAAALGTLGVQVGSAGEGKEPAGSPLCFQQPTKGDLLCQNHKILGSAQRKHRSGLLQHGGLLLAQCAITPSLPGIKEVTGIELSIAALTEALVGSFVESTGWRVVRQDWSETERGALEALATGKYSAAAWSCKR